VLSIIGKQRQEVIEVTSLLKNAGWWLQPLSRHSRAEIT
jgi:hypothetical protein